MVIERLGCELEQVWLTLALVSMPFFLILAIPEEARGLLLFFLVLAILVPFAPYSVDVKEHGIVISSVFTTHSVKWSDIQKVRYNDNFKMLTIKSRKHFTVIPFGIWFHTKATNSYFMLMDYINKNVDPEKVHSKRII